MTRRRFPPGTISGCALRFDGNDDVMTVNGGLATGAPLFTICGWVRPVVQTPGADNYRIFLAVGGQADYSVYACIRQITPITALSWGVYGRYDFTTSTVTYRDWIWFALSGGGVGVESFRAWGKTGGQLLAEAQAYVYNLPTTNVVFGGGGLAYPGGADFSHVRIYGSVLSDADCLTLQNGGEISSAPIRYWKFEDGIGTTAHEEIGNTNDSFSGASWIGDAPCSNNSRTISYGVTGAHSLYFDGAGDYVTGTHGLPLLTNVLSLELWVRPVEHINTTTCITVGSGTLCAYLGLTAGCPIMGNSDDDISCETKCKSGVWSHIVATWNGPNVALYVNGKLARTLTDIDVAVAIPTNAVLIGSGVVDDFKGNMYSVRIHSVSLTLSEVVRLYQGEAPTVTPDRWWTCENPGSGATCHEEIVGTNDPITGATWTNVAPRIPRSVA